MFDNKTFGDAGSGAHAASVAMTYSALEVGDVPIAALAKIALREGNSSLPIYRAHRWFARRLGSQFRAILTAATLPAGTSSATFWKAYRQGVDLSDTVVLDPFLGGGTALVEARRLGAGVIGFDIDPVAVAISRFELEAGAPCDTNASIDALLDEVGTFVRSYHETLVDGVVRPVLHHFWVETHACRSCGHEYDLHPHHQLAHNAAKHRQWVFCGGCGDVHELALSRKVLKCHCDHSTRIDQGPFQEGDCVCPICGFREAHADMGRPAPRWRLFAQEYIVGSGTKPQRLFKPVRTQDLTLFETAANKLARFEAEIGPAAPARAIPAEGRSSMRPLIHGVTHYRQLFNDRQLLHLAVLGHCLSQVADTGAQRLLQLAFSEHLTTNCMYTAYAFGYRRTSALFSIHGYRHIVRPVEVNPWLQGVGRGTFLNALAKLRRVQAYARAPYVYAPVDGMLRAGTAESFAGPVATSPIDVVRGAANAAVVNQSSEDLACVPSGSVDLCLSDPPYWDNVSYSELSDFYLAWHQHHGFAHGHYADATVASPMAQSLAAVKRCDDSKSTYVERLTAVFGECHRVLKTSGRFVFTYHHVSAFAWGAIAQALEAAGFRCVGIVPMRGEGQGGLHSYDGTIKWDAVVTCRPRQRARTGRPLELSGDQIAEAVAAVQSYRRTLGGAKSIGFREPDEVNLLRALLCSKALGSPAHGTCMTELEQALTDAPNMLRRRTTRTRK